MIAMTVFETHEHPRGHPSHPGRFADKGNTNPDDSVSAAMADPEYEEVRVVRDVRISRQRTPLPELPEELTPSSTSWSFGEPDNRVFTTFEVGVDDPVSISVWVDDDGDKRNSIEDGAEETGWDPEDDELFLEYAHAVHERIEENVESVKQQLFDDAVEQAITASVVGE